MKKKSTKEKSIIMLKKDVFNFFGNATQVAAILKMTSAGVGQWPDEIPEAQAWNLLHISKKPKYAEKGEIKVRITI